MKKILLIIVLLITASGCVKINDNDISILVNEVQNSKLELSNIHRQGYKYYLPVGLMVNKTEDFNEIIVNKNIKYYLYVDIVSYYNKIEKDYKINDKAFISEDISNNDKKGYLEVNQKNDKYLIEIMYNYAKIELIVNKDNLEEAITNSIIILSTIKYNNDIIENIMGENVLNFNEEQLDIFEAKGSESNFLEYIQEYDAYEGTEIPDLDLIN
ncbi:MAG: hypothetical protein PHH51_02115 [Bacilli bacterium]|nr:hypothetical protein [Bacilli bacterium]MDD3895880.1 hypothetical protein [Bacilli bacterium]MDD4407758.1 hypothetical protein [Bacilli bacterium]